MSEKRTFKKAAEPLVRSLSFTEPLIDEAKRTATFPFSSELCVPRWFGGEILDHSPGSVDLARLNDGGALLVNHDTGRQIGVIEKAWLEDAERRCWCTARFSRSEDAQEIFQDVVDKIRRNVSCRYDYDEDFAEFDQSGTKDEPNYRFKKWMPLEVSFCPVPADATVGMGRSADVPPQTAAEKTPPESSPNTNIKTRSNIMDPVTDPKNENQPEQGKAPVVHTDKIGTYAREMSSIGTEFGFQNEALAAMLKGQSVEEFRNFVMSEQMKRANAKKLPVAKLGLTDTEARGFSIFRVVRSICNPQSQKYREEAAFEMEASRAWCDKFGTQLEGNSFVVPQDVLEARRDFGTGSGAGNGQNLIATNLLAGSYIDALHNLMVTQKLGIFMLTGLIGNVTIPKKTALGTARWGSIDSAAQATNPGIGQIPLTPKKISAYTDIDQSLLAQSSIPAEGLVRDDLVLAHALGLDLAVLKGSGVGDEPRGIYNIAGVNTVDSDLTWANIVGMETKVAEKNALMGTLAYAFGATTAGTLKTTPKIGTWPVFILENGKVNSYDGLTTNQLTADEGIFGNWADAICALWGGLNILVDPYTQALNGKIRLIASQLADVSVRRPESFTVRTPSVS